MTQFFGKLLAINFAMGVITAAYALGAFYLDNLFFQLKITLFLLAALISIYPTSRFFAWGRELAQGVAPALDAAQVTRLRRALHWELVLIAAILLCASLMARGIGS